MLPNRAQPPLKQTWRRVNVDDELVPPVEDAERLGANLATGAREWRLERVFVVVAAAFAAEVDAVVVRYDFLVDKGAEVGGQLGEGACLLLLGLELACRVYVVGHLKFLLASASK